MAEGVEISDGWEEKVDLAIEAFFDDRLGPDIADDARRYCPERTGDLKRSIEHHLEDGDLIVSATGSDEKSYAKYVEMGTPEHVIRARFKQMLFWEGALHPVKQVVHPEQKPQPFLRPALFQKRSE